MTNSLLKGGSRPAIQIYICTQQSSGMAMMYSGRKVAYVQYVSVESRFFPEGMNVLSIALLAPFHLNASL